MVKTKTRKIKEAIKTNKNVTRVTQHDADGAGGTRFVHSTPEEEKEIINTKLRERISMQEELRKTNLVSMYQYTELECLEDIYNDDSKDRPKWYGIDMPKKLLAVELRIKTHKFTETMRALEYKKQQLKSVGFSDKQLEDVMMGKKIIKNVKTLKKMEKT